MDLGNAKGNGTPPARLLIFRFSPITLRSEIRRKAPGKSLENFGNFVRRMILKESDRRPIVRLALTRAELALSIGMSTSSIDKMVEEGALPRPRKWHTRKLWVVTEVEAALLDLPVDGAEDENSWDDEADRPKELTPRQRKNQEEAIEQVKHLMSLSQEEQREIHQQDAHEWQAAVLASALGARERTVLKQLASAGVAGKVHSNNVKGAGADTIERLKLRGYVDWDFRKKFPDRHENYWITAAGFAAWQGVEHLPTMGPPKKTEKKEKRKPAGKPKVRPFL